MTAPMPDETLSDQVAKMLTNRTTNGALRLDAYYYSFESTGVESIDRILSAVACAGKSYHHTDSWSEPTDEIIWDGNPDSIPKINKGALPSWVDAIQQTANEAAALLAARDEVIS